MNGALRQFQEDIFAKLLSCDALATVNIVEQRKLLIASEVEISSVWITPRGGKCGTGIIVGMPFIDEESKETGISDVTINVQIVCLEQPNLSNKTGGSGITAEALVMLVRTALRGFLLDGVAGGIFTEGRSIEPGDADDVVSYKLTVKAKLRQPTAQRVPMPVLNASGLAVTLTCSDSGAFIYYTVDGTLPWPDGDTSNTYSAPFNVASGTVVRAAAYKSGLEGSNVILRTII